MNPIEIDGNKFYPASYVAELWGLKAKTIERYASPSSKKLRGCVRWNGELYVPSNSIRPIVAPVAQGLIWGILEIKNSPDSFLDLTEFGIPNEQLGAVLDELEEQLYIDKVEAYVDQRDRLIKARLTEKAFGVVRYRKQLKGNEQQRVFNPELLQTMFAGVQTLVQLTEFLHGRC